MYHRLLVENKQIDLLSFCSVINPFQHDKSLDQTKLRTFADDKLNVTKMIISVILKINNSWPELYYFENSFYCH